MKEQLKLLEELQQHDARLHDIQGTLKSLPEKLERMRSDLRKVEKMLAEEQGKLAEVERWRAEQEAQLKREEEAIVKAKGKLQGVKTSKEYMATQREVETTRKMVAEREEEVLKLLGAVEQSKKSTAAHAADVAALYQEVADEEQAIKTRMTELEKQAAELSVEREVAAKKVRPDVLKHYNTIRMRRGLAVVPVENGVCGGCNMSIPPQLYNTLQRGSSIEQCPVCRRIIYWERIMEPEAPPPEPQAAPAKPAAGPPAPADDESPEPKARAAQGPASEDAEHKAAQA